MEMVDNHLGPWIEVNMPKYWDKTLLRNLAICCGLLCLLSIALPVYAQSALTIDQQVKLITPQTILASLNKQLPNLMRLVTAIAYVVGFYLVISGIIKLKHLGEARTQMSQEHHVSGPLIQIAVGTLLIYLPSAVQIGMSTFWAEPNPYGYLELSDQWGELLKLCLGVVQLVGVIAFIKGLILLSHVGGGHSQQGAFGKGVTHIIGGIFCINMYQVIQVLFGTIGIQL
jgi:intracellular multiplication protein IcmC